MQRERALLTAEELAEKLKIPTSWVGNLFSGRNFEEFFRVLFGPPKLFHALVYRIGVNWIGGEMRHLGCSPVPGFVLLLTDKRPVMLVDVFPAEHPLCG